MALSDLFLRAKAKLQATDLWLHPAGADGGAPAPALDSGTITTVAALSGSDTVLKPSTSSPGWPPPIPAPVPARARQELRLELALTGAHRVVGVSDEELLLLA